MDLIITSSKNKLLLLTLLFFNSQSNYLFSSENDSNPSVKQNQLDYFVIRFEVNEREESHFKRLFRVSQTKSLDGILLATSNIVFRAADKSKTSEKDHTYFDSAFENFTVNTVNRDILILIHPIDPIFNYFEITLLNSTGKWKRFFGSVSVFIEPGKKYIIKFKHLDLLESWLTEIKPRMELEVQDIQENQLKVRSVLNEVLQNVPTDINKLISEYTV